MIYTTDNTYSPGWYHRFGLSAEIRITNIIQYRGSKSISPNKSFRTAYSVKCDDPEIVMLFECIDVILKG